MSGKHHAPQSVGEAPAENTQFVVELDNGDRGDRAARNHPMPNHVQIAWLVPVVLCSIAGLWILSRANAASRLGDQSVPQDLLFWTGLLLIFVPTALRVLATNVIRTERLILIVVLGLSLYLVKVQGSPGSFTAFDEFIHVRSTQDILDSHHLFSPNPLLPTASYYPGLSALTAGLVEISGLSVFVCGLAVIGVARLLISTTLFLIAEQITRSGRAAAVASLLYAANPMFLFWSSPFAYEHLALPLAAFVVWWIAKTRNQFSASCFAITSLGILAVTVTHHVVGFSLGTLLVLWWLAEMFVRDRNVAANRQVGAFALITCTVTTTWFFAIARPAADYLLAGNMYPALRELGFLLSGKSPPRELYKSGGFAPPWWEPIAGFAAVGIVLLALLPALLAAWQWRRRVPVLIAIVFGIAFPLSLVPRLTTFGVAVSGRTSEYLYTAVGCVIGLLFSTPLLASRLTQKGKSRPNGALCSAWARWHKSVVVSVVAVALLSVVFVGNVVVGKPFYQRLPEGPLTKGYEWSVQPDVIAASEWARTHLGSNKKFGANAVDALALGTYGMQDVADRSKVWPVFFADSMKPTVYSDIRSQHLKYILINWRMARGVPLTPGFYFDAYEPGAGEYKRPFPMEALEKFQTDPCIRSIYTTGAVQIIDLTRIESGECP